MRRNARGNQINLPDGLRKVQWGMCVRVMALLSITQPPHHPPLPASLLHSPTPFHHLILQFLTLLESSTPLHLPPFPPCIQFSLFLSLPPFPPSPFHSSFFFHHPSFFHFSFKHRSPPPIHLTLPISFFHLSPFTHPLHLSALHFPLQLLAYSSSLSLSLTFPLHFLTTPHLPHTAALVALIFLTGENLRRYRLGEDLPP